MTNKKPNAQHYNVPKTETINFRLTYWQKLHLIKMAKLQGLTLTAYIFQVLHLDVHVEHLDVHVDVHLDHSE